MKQLCKISVFVWLLIGANTSGYAETIEYEQILRPRVQSILVCEDKNTLAAALKETPTEALARGAMQLSMIPNDCQLLRSTNPGTGTRIHILGEERFDTFTILTIKLKLAETDADGRIQTAIRYSFTPEFSV